MREFPGWLRRGGLITAALMAAVSAGSADSSDSTAATSAEQTSVAQAGSAEAKASPENTSDEALPAAVAARQAAPGEARGLLAGLDTSLRSVDLAEIHFDTFDGGSILLSEISAAGIERLIDAIPPLDSARTLLPEERQDRVGEVRYISPAAVDFLSANDPVLGYVADDGQAYAYSLGILNFHEIVNDTLGGRAVVITYCPLCRSGVVYERVLDGRLLTFGNTSALYQNDLVMFDRETTSYWFQTGGEAVVGTLTGARLPVLPSRIALYETWLADHPDTLVLSTETGFVRRYEIDAFAGYAEILERGRFPFPVEQAVLDDDRLPTPAIVLALDDGERAVVYPLAELGNAAIHDSFAGQDLVIFSSLDGPSGAVFAPQADGMTLSFSWDDGAGVDDETSSRWNLGGRAIHGPLAGGQLTALPSRSAFWFSIRAAFETIDVVRE